MKKLIVALMASVFAVALAACGKTEPAKTFPEGSVEKPKNFKGAPSTPGDGSAVPKSQPD
jgi:predicted small lipoprotein YifL